ncbi:UNVERIFIED_CONTAM: putative pectinesterase/pectinesterase inhibitor 46 [Sesamum radiatum]|uniref:Pectinesterase n=1 Tax=Sesamum radiatum TaxID=300843 RepID=A0AAW2LDB5_SESRA
MMKAVVAFLIAIAFVSCKAKHEKHFKTALIDSGNGDSDSVLLYKLSVQAAIDEVSRVSEDFENGTLARRLQGIKVPGLPSAMESCRMLLSMAQYNLNQSVPISISSVPSYDTRFDFRTWLSAAIADFETCVDGFEYSSDEARKLLSESLDNSTKHVINSLSIISKIDEDVRKDKPSSILDNSGLSKVRSDWPPSWLSSSDRKLLFGSNPTMNADVVVAADGSGNYRTINEAINVVPPHSTRRFVIYVKKGLYLENVKINMNKSNIMMYGDGMDQTIVSGSLSNSTQLLATILTATFAVDGWRFIARDMGFRNTAGPANMQAVALVSSSDQSVFYKCNFDGYQDTLFTLSNRQFYRECRISGTIDFIFGKAAVVFQSCNILVKKPLRGQKNVITASGKEEPGVIQGISIQNCYVSAAEPLGGARTFLGRPWKNYATTVFMESWLESLIDPEGWMPWTPNVPPPDTIYYAEYNNRGPGAVTSNRVKWKGLKLNITSKEANRFTVRTFLHGVEWIPATGVPFKPDLWFGR